MRTTTGETEVYITPFPSNGQRWQVSTDGGCQARWRGDGRELYYLSLDGVMNAVTLAPDDKRPNPSSPSRLFETRINVNPGVDQYAVVRDGSRFLVIEPSADDRLARLNVVLNWPLLVEKH